MSDLSGSAWSPAPITTVRTITAASITAFAHLLDVPVPEVVPPLWHWFSFTEQPRSTELGEDGHPTGGGLLPPMPNRRRLWGGGSFKQHAPIPIGASVECTKEVVATTAKSGRSGAFLLVTERHTYRLDGDEIAVDDIDLVYRSREPLSTAPVSIEPAAAAPSPTTATPESLRVHIDPAFLFRFSALTANSHRIHYDAAYAIGIEGHRNLVVHGPLTALLMLEISRRSSESREVRSFDLRMQAPSYVGEVLRFEQAPGSRAITAHVDDRLVASGELDVAL